MRIQQIFEAPIAATDNPNDPMSTTGDIGGVWIYGNGSL